jgi:hypothetical protein
VVREGWVQGGEMTQALYAHMNNKTIKIKKKPKKRKSKTTTTKILNNSFAG